MKVGDLVKMKNHMFWVAKNNRRIDWTDQLGIVVEQSARAVKVLFPDGAIKASLAENYEVVSEGR